MGLNHGLQYVPQARQPGGPEDPWICQSQLLGLPWSSRSLGPSAGKKAKVLALV